MDMNKINLFYSIWVTLILGIAKGKRETKHYIMPNFLTQ